MTNVKKYSHNSIVYDELGRVALQVFLCQNDWLVAKYCIWGKMEKISRTLHVYDIIFNLHKDPDWLLHIKDILDKNGLYIIVMTNLPQSMSVY